MNTIENGETTGFASCSARLSMLALWAAVGLAGVEGGTAQSPAPADPVTAAVEFHVQTLHQLGTQGIYAIENLQSGAKGTAPVRETQDPPPKPRTEASEGSTAARLWANIRDAHFDSEGRLLALLVERPVVDPRAEAELRLLPAAAVRWDESRRQWVVIEPNMQFAELEVVSPGKGPAPPPPSRLASQLARAILDPALTSPPPVSAPAVRTPDAPEQKTPQAKSPVVWMAPIAKRLLLVVVPIAVSRADGQVEEKNVAVPWSLVRITGTGTSLQVQLAATRAMLASAPECGNPEERPLWSLRQRCYGHFQIAAPSWDPASAKPRESAKQ